MKAVTWILLLTIFTPLCWSENTPSTCKEPIRTITEDDVLWDKKLRKHKRSIISGLNYVARGEYLCKHIDPSSLYISSTRGTKKDPVFFVPCGDMENDILSVRNIFFSKSEADQIDWSVPRRVCWDDDSETAVVPIN